jgi:hypothetical protein
MSGYIRFYRQCRLARGNMRQMAWIPEKFAVEGRYVRLTEAGVQEDGWQVTGVGARLAEDYVLERSQDYKHTRRASDV